MKEDNSKSRVRCKKTEETAGPHFFDASGTVVYSIHVHDISKNEKNVKRSMQGAQPATIGCKAGKAVLHM